MYKSVQYIGVELITEKAYGLGSEEDDILYRCEVVENIINKVLSSGTATSSPDCLKIVAFPEFLFRGSIGAYTMEGVAQIVENLRKMVNRPQFENWLFVFGTIVGYSNNTPDNGKKYETYNFSFIQKGNSGEDKSYVVLKKNKSCIDFERDPKKPRVTVWNTEYLEPIKLKNIRGEQQILNYDGNAIINVDGLKIGVEICMDNLLKRIDPSIRYNRNLDVHIVISCGLPEKEVERVGKLREGGVFILCDGQKGEVRMGVGQNSNDKLPEQTIITYKPQNIEMFNDIFYAQSANIVVFEPTLIMKLEKAKNVEKDTGCRIM